MLTDIVGDAPWKDREFLAAERAARPVVISVRKTGTAAYPWEARCSVHKSEETHLAPGIGAVGFGTRGIGNRTWGLAATAAVLHWVRSHDGTGWCTVCRKRRLHVPGSSGLGGALCAVCIYEL